jgi:hypothetical protein
MLLNKYYKSFSVESFSFFNFLISDTMAFLIYGAGLYFFFFLKVEILFSSLFILTRNFFLLLNFYVSNALFFNKVSFLELFLDGIYYRLKYYRNLHVLGFLIGFNHYILFYLPSDIYVKLHMKKRRFFLYSFDKEKLSNVAHFIVNFKYPNLFIGKGVKLKNVVYRRKLVKKKKKR